MSYKYKWLPWIGPCAREWGYDRVRALVILDRPGQRLDFKRKGFSKGFSPTNLVSIGFSKGFYGQLNFIGFLKGFFLRKLCDKDIFKQYF